VKDLEHSRVGTLQTEFALEMIANSRDVQVATVEAIAEAFASDRPRQLPAEKGRFGTNFNPTSWGGCRVADPDVALNLLIVAANKIGYALPESLVGDADTTIQPLIAPEDRVTVSAPSGPR